MNELRVSLVQSELEWESPEANRRLLDHRMGTLDGSRTDLIVLPEMFATGFTMNAEGMAEPAEASPTLDWMRRQARERDCAIAGSLAIADGGARYNRLYWVTPDGGVEHYDKRHLFRMGDEPLHYSMGQARKIVELKGFRLLLSVCYDLRFPVWLRQRPSAPEPFEYDALLCVANWPAPRRRPWRTLLQARAIENLGYVIGVNRVGRDGNGLTYAGDSMVVDFKGELMIDHPTDTPFVETVTLSAAALSSFRDTFPAWRDADAFALIDLDDHLP
ncbi:amidohydrolase [Salinicola acroporae]|uniref:Amidohydrolase n=1 Tax=Salinicola acroporae TaxID=1541440 RepID=A0ABT6I6I9_9GAMM|nr:amidohydrolase [Salinicola acroporae]MDH4573117.1 amidohydrolase [Salinicola acroporae]